MKKLTSFLLVCALVFSGGLAGCGSQKTQSTEGIEKTELDSSNEAQTSGANASNGEQVTITFMRTGTPEVLRGIFGPIIENFEKEYPNIKVDMQDLGWSDAEKSIQVMASSQTLPDVMYHLPSTIYDMADKGLVMDLTPYLDEELTNDIYPSLLQAGQHDGKQYMIPSGASTLMLWYNTELFEQAGLDPATPPSTWEELVAAAKAISEKTDAAGIGLYGKPSGGETSFVFESLFAGAIGGATWDGKGYTYELSENRNEAIKTLALMQGLTKYAQPSVEEFNRFDTRTLLRDGNVGMSLDLVNMANQLGDGLENGKFKVALLPAGDSGKNLSAINVGGFFIPTNSKHPKEAWTFLRYLMNTDNQVAHSTYGSVPILKSEGASYHGEYRDTVTKSVENSVAEGVSPKTNALWQATGEEIQLLLMNKQTPEETLDHLIAQHKEIMEN